MQCANIDEWLQYLQDTGVLATTTTTAATAQLVLVDGPAAVDRHIRKANSPQRLGRILAFELDHLAYETRASELVLVFEQRVVCPLAFARTPWTADQADMLTAHIMALSAQGASALRVLAESSHGPRGATEWLRPIFKEPDDRAALWQHPLFSWQLVQAIADEVVTHQCYPDTLQHVAVTGTSEALAAGAGWSEVWASSMQCVRRVYSGAFNRIPRGFGHPQTQTISQFVLANLHVGLASLSWRQWSRPDTAHVSTVRAFSTHHDVYHQMSQLIYRLVAATPTWPPTVWVHCARDDALPYLLLLLHRVYDNGSQVRVLVSWADSRRASTTDLTETYLRLRDHLRATFALSVADFVAAMILSGAATIGARPCESTPAWLLQALAAEARQAGCPLSDTGSLRRSGGPIAVSPGAANSSPTRSAVFQDSKTYIHDRSYAAATLATVAHRVKTAVGEPVPAMPLFTRVARPPDAYVQALYAECYERLSPEWQVAPPPRRIVALARARRAAWLMEYMCMASTPLDHSRVTGRMCEQRDVCPVWGFVWVDKLLELLIGDARRFLTTLAETGVQLRQQRTPLLVSPPSSTVTPPFIIGRTHCSDVVALLSS